MDEITIKFENRSITASMDDLNYISILAQKASEYMKFEMYYASASEASNLSDAIREASNLSDAILDLLWERGYYEEN